MEEKSIIKVDRSFFDELIKLLDLKNIKCTFCGIELTKDNFGFIARDNNSCDSFLCLSRSTEIFGET